MRISRAVVAIILTVEVQYLSGGSESADGRLERRRRVPFVDTADQFFGAQHLARRPLKNNDKKHLSHTRAREFTNTRRDEHGAEQRKSRARYERTRLVRFTGGSPPTSQPARPSPLQPRSSQNSWRKRDKRSPNETQCDSFHRRT